MEAVPPYSAVRGYRASCHLKIPASSLQTVKKTCVKEPSWRTGKSGLRAGGKVCQNAHNGCQRHPAKDPETQEILVLFQDEKEGQQREVASPLPLSAHLGWEVASTCGFPKQTNKKKSHRRCKNSSLPHPKYQIAASSYNRMALSSDSASHTIIHTHFNIRRVLCSQEWTSQTERFVLR